MPVFEAASISDPAPDLGCVGLTETDARAKFDCVDIYLASFRPLKAALCGRPEKTLMKIVVDGATDRILGVHISRRGFDWQLQIYADAGHREGLKVRAAYVHDLKEGRRTAVDISDDKLKQAEAEVICLVDSLKAREFKPSPGLACARCDVRSICKHAGKSA